MTWSKDRVGGLMLFGIFLAYGFNSQSIELLPLQEAAALTARTLPYTLTLLGLAGSLWLMLKPTASALLNWRGLHWPRYGGFLLLMSLYGLALRPMGFLLASAAFLAIGFMLLGERRWLRLLGVAAGFTTLFWLLMSYGLGVHLPPLPALGGS